MRGTGLLAGFFRRAFPAAMIVPVLLLTACDGYERTLYFREPGAPKGAWGMRTTEFVVEAGADLPAAVNGTAAELGMRKISDDPLAYSISLDESREFTLRLEPVTDGLWSLKLIDVPGRDGRSRTSWHAELGVFARIDAG